ncbi:MAG: MFS transporter [Opitutales bacterium]
MQEKNSLKPFVILAFIYFLIVGFITTINGQLQAPLRTAFLGDAGFLKNTFATLISFFFFLGYLISSPIGGKWLNKYAYKRTLIRALIFMIFGLLMFFLSALFSVSFKDAILQVGEIAIPYGYFIFLVGSYLAGSSAAVTQVVVNPYIAGYDLAGTQPVQRMNIVCGIASFGTTIAPFFITIVIFAGRTMDSVDVNQLLTPFFVLMLLVVAVTLLTMRMPIPDLAHTRQSSQNAPKESIWSFRHFKLGVIAIFFYVGAEVCIGANINLYAHELQGTLSFFGYNDLVIGGYNLGMPALIATIYWGSIMIGRMISSTLSSVRPRVQLVASTLLAVLFLSLAIIFNNIWLIALVGLFHSVMWSCVFTLSVEGLKEYTAKASGIFMCGVFGGAVFPVFQGIFADVIGSWRWTWTIAIFCEIVILLYALKGSYPKKKED